MIDQAQRLREIINNMKKEHGFLGINDIDETKESNGSNQPGEPKKPARIITVTSGKGGVGKTNLTLNIAITLCNMGLKVLIIDADIGLANVDVLLGCTPRFTLGDILGKNKSVADVICDGPNGTKLILGGSGIEELIQVSEEGLKNLIDDFEHLDNSFDIILIDTGAGLSENVTKFAMASDELIIVTTPEPTSITDAYALIKFVAKRDANKVIRIIVNKAENMLEGKEVSEKLILVAKEFLHISLHPLGVVLDDGAVVKAVKLQQPFVSSFPNSRVSNCVKYIGSKLVEKKCRESKDVKKGIRGFIGRLASYTRGY